ncbi:hypothetical protein C5167_040409 [Papaver somniferum]|uniref:Uncharacterized protein n=1 Tax=Papaver somniferum TaxID=3469 RepID=A0A4Y7IHB7_PAPSO|nr:hypothetical protein C5167_040409 [Papaver somniferum]
MGSRAILISPDKQTLVLGTSAGSKAVSDVLKESNIVNTDGANAGNPLAVVDYVEDMYKFYKVTEISSTSIHQVYGYMDLQYDITERERMIVVDWLIDVHREFQLSPEVLYLAVQIFDRYLAMDLVATKGEMQLIGAAEANEKMGNMVFFLAELGLLQYAMLKYCPSMLAASAVYAARCTQMISPLWSETLKLNTGYSESQLKDCAKKMISFHSEAAAEHECLAVLWKYSEFM